MAAVGYVALDTSGQATTQGGEHMRHRLSIGGTVLVLLGMLWAFGANSGARVG
jgi:hypothetical protein